MDPTKFEQLVQFRVPINLSAAIDQAAKLKCQSRSDYVRQSIIRQLEADGIEVAVQQWALVSGVSILTRHIGAQPRLDDPCHWPAGFSPADGNRWLPIENEDSEPFDAAKHWRQKPLALRVDGDRVVRTYPVVLKSLERA